jgi:hypothetical protein
MLLHRIRQEHACGLSFVNETGQLFQGNYVGANKQLHEHKILAGLILQIEQLFYQRVSLSLIGLDLDQVRGYFS